MSPFVNLGFGDIQWATGNLEYDYYEDYGKIVSPLATGHFFSVGGDGCVRYQWRWLLWGNRGTVGL